MVKLNSIIKGSGKSLCFLHGFPDFSYSWIKQCSQFESQYRVIIPDLPGYNLSEKPIGLKNYSLDALAEILIAFISSVRVGSEKITLIGHDWGGILSWVLAASFPEYFDKLIIINAPHPVLFSEILANNPEQQDASEYIKVLLQEDACEKLNKHNYAWLREAFIDRGLRKGFINPEEVDIYINAWSQPGALEAMINYYKASFSLSNKGDLQFNHGLNNIKKIEIPTRVIWGEWDRAILLPNLDGMKEWANDLQVITVPERTHWIVHEDSPAINKYISNFLL